MKKAKNEPTYCWQYWSCVKVIREKCPIWLKKYGKRCWLVAKCSPKVKREFKHCWHCPWYKKQTKRLLKLAK